LLISLLGLTCLGAPSGVDGLSPGDVAKAVAALKENFVRPDALSEPEMSRATLQGLLDRLAPAVSLASGPAAGGTASPFYSETCDATTEYLRPGDLANVAKAAQVLKDWSAKGLAAVVLDLRGTPASSDFDAGAALEQLFCAKGTQMFSLTAGKTHAFSADADPVFKGILVVLVDGDTAEAPEAVAASLRKCAKALIVGDKTAGREYQYRDFPLDGEALRVAVAKVILPDGTEPGESGLKPDISAGLGDVSKEEVMRSISTKGVASVTKEYDRAHLNEAALVAQSNPEVDEIEAEQAGRKPPEPLIDRQLQRALDLVTSISIYQAKGDVEDR
jgi:hypothetical protein